MRSAAALLPAILLATASWAHAASAPAKPAAVTEQGLIERLRQAEAALVAAKDPGARVSALGGLKTYLTRALETLPSRNMGDGVRRLRASLDRLSGYLAKIDDRGFSPGRCAEYRGEIFLSFSPHAEAPEYVPGEAREALKILSLVCARPELAEIPAPAQE